MKRRLFLTTVALAPGILTIGCKPRHATSTATPDAAITMDTCQIARRTAENARSLSVLEWSALEAACERILPADHDPGARHAGVINYIDSQLQYPPISSFRSLLQAGATELDRQASTQGGQLFSALPPKEQDAILTAVQNGSVGSDKGARFLEVLIMLTLEGFLSDPIYGGNRDAIGWKMIQLSPRIPGALCAYPGLG